MPNPTQQESYGQIANYNISPGTRADGQSSALEVTSKGNLKASLFDANNNAVSPNPLNLSPYDYVAMVLSAGDTTETYTFKTGGSGGTTTNTVVLVYTDSTRSVLSTVTKT